MDVAGAIFSEDRTKRIVLWRVWKMPGLKIALCIGLNPSTAKESENDRTIDFLIRLLRHQGYDGLRMRNLFTNVTSKPHELPECKSEQDVKTIQEFASHAADVFFCWGTFKEAQERAKDIVGLFPDAKCFGKNKDFSPKHPAWYIRNGVKNMDLVPVDNFH